MGFDAGSIGEVMMPGVHGFQHAVCPFDRPSAPRDAG